MAVEGVAEEDEEAKESVVNEVLSKSINKRHVLEGIIVPFSVSALCASHWLKRGASEIKVTPRSLVRYG